MVAGQERVVWNPALSIPAREFEFSDPEVARIQAAIETWDSYGAAADRRWLQPLVETLFSPELQLRKETAPVQRSGSTFQKEGFTAPILQACAPYPWWYAPKQSRKLRDH